MQVQAANVIDDNNNMTACGCVRAYPALRCCSNLSMFPTSAGNQIGQKYTQMHSNNYALGYDKQKPYFRHSYSNKNSSKHSNSSLQFWRAAAFAAETQQ